ncbi:hypothetical protein [Leifsonia sp. fls2-241-R2A-40a]|uniref:hypothetical protein n=1 Tax=Leifsonia sp. fls2-241-R2A-40a TaxID=3040290 RepID=UPI00254E0047|nr:hypothetical protein [Leifsonia sp. fls2-241-R2A-40a]
MNAKYQRAVAIMEDAHVDQLLEALSGLGDRTVAIELDGRTLILTGEQILNRIGRAVMACITGPWRDFISRAGSPILTSEEAIAEAAASVSDHLVKLREGRVKTTGQGVLRNEAVRGASRVARAIEGRESNASGVSSIQRMQAFVAVRVLPALTQRLGRTPTDDELLTAAQTAWAAQPQARGRRALTARDLQPLQPRRTGSLTVGNGSSTPDLFETVLYRQAATDADHRVADPLDLLIEREDAEERREAARAGLAALDSETLRMVLEVFGQDGEVAAQAGPTARKRVRRRMATRARLFAAAA